MNILLLGDIIGPSGRKAICEKLPIVIKKKILILLLLTVKILEMQELE